jgi:hypothetical protein
LLIAALCCAACASAEDGFTSGRTLRDCSDTLPVCSTNAGCVLDGQTFARASFAQGGSQRIVVKTDGAADVEVSIFLRTEESPGTDTEVTWYEVGCRQRFNAQSGGRDIFAEAGPDRIWTRTQRLTTAGDHLIEVFSDMQADVLLRVTVTAAQ